MRSLIALILIFVIGISLPSAFGITSDTLYSCSVNAVSPPDRNTVFEMDSTDGSPINVYLLDVDAGSTAFSNPNSGERCFGMATDPTDGIIYAILGDDSGSDKYLATMDSTFVTPVIHDGKNYDGYFNATAIAEFDSPFGANDFCLDSNCPQSLFFDASGQMYVTGNNFDSFDKSVWSVNKVTAQQISNLCSTFYNSNSFALNYDNDLLYIVGRNATDTGIGVFDPSKQYCVGNVELQSFGSDVDMAYDTVISKFIGRSTSGLSTIMTIGIDGLGDALRTQAEINVDKTNLHIRDHWGMAYSIIITPPDTTAPVISATASEPVTLFQDESFDGFANVQCIDDVDGTIVPNGNFSYDGELTIDTSKRGIQTQDYDCIDNGDNTGYATIEYIIKQVSSSSGGSSSSSSSGGTATQSSIPQLSDIPTLSFSDSPSQQGVDEGSSISDLFSNLFSNRLNPVEPTETQPVNSPFFSSPQSSGSPTTSDRASPVADFFSNLFAGFFN